MRMTFILKSQQIKFREWLLSFSPKSFVSPSKNKKLKISVLKTINSPVVLNECVSWSVTLREEHRLRVFQNMVEEDISM
jgi:hypothetical protein